MKHTALLLAATLLAAACGSGTDTRDMEKPSIGTEGIVASPAECDAYRIGDTLHFCYRMTDNVELGKFNLEIHGNQDHHTHSTSAIDCDLDPATTPVNPWVYNQDFDIPAGLRDHVAHVDIIVPAGIDLGDYHFMIRLTDRAGWQQLRSVAIKVQ